MEPLEEPAPKEEAWRSLVPTEGNGNWVTVDFGGEGDTAWKDGVLSMTQGADLTGMRWEGELPTAPYEIRLEARKTLGDDFLCGLTVPTRDKDTCVTFIAGGWGGMTVGVSSLDGLDASENETTSFHKFDQDRWYSFRLEVGTEFLAGWIDDEEIFRVDTTGRELGLRPGSIDLCAPLGVASFQVDAQLRKLEWRPLAKAGESSS